MDCFSFAVIGHIDTGKSTLCGHILVKTGGISSDEFMAIKRRTEKDNAKYALYARVLDIFEDELENKYSKYRSNIQENNLIENGKHIEPKLFNCIELSGLVMRAPE